MDKQKLQPLVSVLMTVYNREQYIAEAIESVIASSYTNWELIIVDDKSTDGSVAIAKKFEETDERIKVYINEKNLGDYPNRNHVASFAKGKYIKYLDSDDLIYSNGLEIMVNSMEQFPEAALGISWSKNELLKPYPVEVSPQKVYKQQFFGTGFFAVGPTGTIINREKFLKLKGLTNIRYTGDFDSWLKFSQKHSVVVFQPGLIWWRQHDGQEYLNGQDFSKYLKSTSEISLKYIKDSNSPLTSDERQKALLLIKKRQARRVLYYLIKGKIRSALDYYKNSSLTSVFNLFSGLVKQPVIYNFEQHL